jgi:hypothetical protein
MAEDEAVADSIDAETDARMKHIEAVSGTGS